MGAGVIGEGSSKSRRRESRDREVVRRLLCWFDDYGRQLPWRHSTMEPWQVLVVEILLQQTRAERIAAFVPAFLADFPSLHALAATDEQLLAKRLTALGLQNRRAGRLVCSGPHATSAGTDGSLTPSRNSNRFQASGPTPLPRTCPLSYKSRSRWST